MRSSIAAATVVAASALGASAVSVPRSSEAQAPRVVQHEIHRRNVADPIAADRKRLARRSGTIGVSLENEETLYFMAASIGTPAQDFELHIDTGSSDLWVNVATSSLCQESGNPCSVSGGGSGTYNPNASSTYEYLNSNFNIKYADGSGAQGVYGTDKVSFGGITIEKQQFGVGYESTTQQGLIGIGYPTNEVAVEYNDEYANVPVSLVNDGYINVNAYSLWLNDLDANTGSILFGGVNSAKYKGTLETLPILPTGNYYSAFYIALTGVGLNGNAGSISNNLAVPALLDSGTSLMYLPDDIAESIFNSLEATYDSNRGYATVNCNLRNSDATIDFTFSSPTISVAMNELVFIGSESSNGAITCILGISKAGNSQPVLGDTFLRSAYVVYDLYNNQISLAQTDFNSTSDNYEEITKTSGVPNAVSVTNAVTAVSTSYTTSQGPTVVNFNSGAPALVPAMAVSLCALAGSLFMAVL